MADKEGSGEVGSAPQQHGAVEAIKTDVQCAAETETTTSRKQRLPDVYVSSILAMPIEEFHDLEMPSYLLRDNMAEILGVTEEWLEDQRRTHREADVLHKRIHHDFLQYQAEVRDEWFDKGYVEVDDNYFTDLAEIEEEARAIQEEADKKRGPAPAIALDVAPPYDYEKQATRLLAL
ncbi:hypothetical protein CFC21_045083 [Triticum aestivum]|uniref:Uncharacterized protein n=2 Tax=Triticum aestivum TaxID=4565 RepID=A0A9R1FS76_WHEAT|nr:hypothetical protein CFC21_045083 [Triticum aestivum]CDM87243.1 unnamed protein product [Triticum aestivum]